MSVTLSSTPGDQLATQSPDDDTLSPPLIPPTRPDLQRRREMALTARWLRELGGRAASATTSARPAARFTRPVKH
jgi:hypothetical protein